MPKKKSTTKKWFWVYFIYNDCPLDFANPGIVGNGHTNQQVMEEKLAFMKKRAPYENQYLILTTHKVYGEKS